MTDRNPPSRPALRKSVDATVHPALGGRPHAAGHLASGGSKQAAGTAASGSTGGGKQRSKRSATSDVLRPSKQDPAVTLKVSIPKSLRKQLRAAAKQADTEPSDLAAKLIAEGLRG